MRTIDSVKEARKTLKSITSGCAQDTIFMAKLSLLSVEMLDQYVRQSLHFLGRLVAAAEGKRIRRSKGRTPWQHFVANGARAGKPLQQIAREWKEKRR